MYKVLIVDDDELERNGLASCKLLRDLNIEVVAQAWNGLQALNVFDEIKLDIIISDIRMPIMDGLTLTKQIKERNQQVKIILMSGYEDFSAAKQAVHIGAECYLLKPLNLDELNKVLIELISDIEEHKSIEKTNENMRETVKTVQPIIQERLLRDILLGVESATAIQIKKLMSNINLFQDINKIVVLAIKISARNNNKNNYIYMQMIEDLKRQIIDDNDIYFITIQNDLFAAVVTLPSRIDDRRAFSYLERLTKSLFAELRKQTEFDITIAISNIGEMKEQLKILYDQALNALQKRIVHNTNRIYWYEDTIKVPKPLPNVSIVASNLEKSLLTRNNEDVDRIIDDFCEAFIEANVTIDTMHAMCIELLSRFVVLATDNGRDFLSVFENRKIPYKTIIEYKDNKSINKFLKVTFNDVLRLLYSHQSTRAEKITKQVKEIIHHHYMNDLSTDYIAQKVYVTSAHLRRVFKNLTGQTIRDYILSIRMSHARELLFDENLKINEIARRVGYNNDSYFCIAFKKYYGTSPGTFRNEA